VTRPHVAARARFAALLEREPIPLDEAALAIAAEEYPALDPAPYLAQLDALAARVRRTAPGPLRPAPALRALREVLVDEEGFRGNVEEYGDPRNSFLNDVLDRKLGIPISLSVVWMEVARRCGLALRGVGFPGHFLAKVETAGLDVFVDAFHGGELLGTDEVLARFRARSGGRELDPRHLAPVTPRQLLGRMLGNLARIYDERRDPVGSWWIADRLLLLRPAHLEALRDRGLAAGRLGSLDAAERDLGAYLSRAPEAPDADAVREALDGFRARRPLQN
jgi:regulator of sirC expression with transglutaminase-like and TPR domain